MNTPPTPIILSSFSAIRNLAIPLLIKWELIVAVLIFGISLFLLLLSLKTMKDKTFDVEKLTHKISEIHPTKS